MNKSNITLYEFDNAIIDYNIKYVFKILFFLMNKYSLNQILTIIFLFSSNYPCIKHYIKNICLIFK